MPSMAPAHALGLAELDTGVAVQRLGQPLARNMEMSRVQVSYKMSAVQMGLQQSTVLRTQLLAWSWRQGEVRDLQPFHPQLPHLGLISCTRGISQPTDIFKKQS